jgi:hypothetical protein
VVVAGLHLLEAMETHLFFQLLHQLAAVVQVAIQRGVQQEGQEVLAAVAAQIQRQAVLVQQAKVLQEVQGHQLWRVVAAAVLVL